MRSYRWIRGILLVHYNAAKRMGYTIDHFNLSPHYFENFRAKEDKEVKTLILPGMITIPVRSYGWQLSGDNYYRLSSSHSGHQMMVMDIEVLLK